MKALKEYPRIFVTRLPFEVNKKDLEKYFSKYGKIIDIYISKNLSNNKNKGFGFVSFENQISMDKVSCTPHYSYFFTLFYISYDFFHKNRNIYIYICVHCLGAQ